MAAGTVLVLLLLHRHDYGLVGGNNEFHDEQSDASSSKQRFSALRTGNVTSVILTVPSALLFSLHEQRATAKRKIEGRIKLNKTIKEILQMFPLTTEKDWKQHPKGDGWVQITAHVEATCTIEGVVSGNARVFDNAGVYGEARVSGNVWVYGNALVYGNARVFGNARVSGKARVYGDALVSGNAQVSGNALVYGNAQVFGDA